MTLRLYYSLYTTFMRRRMASGYRFHYTDCWLVYCRGDLLDDLRSFSPTQKVTRSFKTGKLTLLAECWSAT